MKNCIPYLNIGKITGKEIKIIDTVKSKLKVTNSKVVLKIKTKKKRTDD